jgi:membrane protease YdiL (CAAX protease family)
MNFFSKAQEGNNAWHLYLIGIFLALGGYFIGQLPLSLFLVYQVSSRTDLGPDDMVAFQENMDFTKFGLDPNFGFFLMLLIFVFAMVGLYAAIKMHKKKFIHLINPSGKINYRKIGYGFGVWAVLIIVAETISYYMQPESYTFRFSASSFFPLLLLALFMLPVQTSFEELFFRGYLMQAFALGSKSKWIAMLITSLLFALMHGMNPEVAKFGWGTMMFYYVSAGAFLALITIMDEGLELALGVHAATNILGATLVTYSGSVLQTETLFITDEIKPWIMILFFYLSAFVFYWLCSVKYQWKPVVSLLEPIDFTDAKTGVVSSETSFP